MNEQHIRIRTIIRTRQYRTYNNIQDNTVGFSPGLMAEPPLLPSGEASRASLPITRPLQPTSALSRLRLTAQRPNRLFDLKPLVRPNFPQVLIHWYIWHIELLNEQGMNLYPSAHWGVGGTCHAIAISGKAIDIDFVIFIQSLRNITRLETNNKITIYVQYYKFSEKVNTLIYGSKYT